VEQWQEFELLCKGIIHIETVCKEWKVTIPLFTVLQNSCTRELNLESKFREFKTECKSIDAV